MGNEKITIMYDSPEAAEVKTITGWVSSGKGGYPSHYYGKDEHMARWAGCTHLKCDCGKIMEKGWTKCDECRTKSARERYFALPYKEWDGKEYVVDWDGDKYFWSEEDLIEYMEENEINEIDLLFCSPIGYSQIDTESVASDSHEDWEPTSELEKKIAEFNEYIQTLPPHSWEPGKIRTNYKLTNS